MKISHYTTKSVWAAFAGLLSLAVTHVAMAVNIANDPLFLAQPVRPIVMLNMSNDHQLFFKAYDDYSDFTDDGVADTTYVHDIENFPYYGYFDSEKCYKYDSGNGRFNPSRTTNPEGYCNYASGSDEWSGNFLNWATMTRMDAVRKILYGGLRSTDTASLTVLERAFLPQDAHSFAKYYNEDDLGGLTPFGSATDAGGNSVVSGGSGQGSGITICNTTEPTNRSQLSQNVSAPPLMRVARGNYSLWASNERWQCRWNESVSGNQGLNDNNASMSGINAASSSPHRSSRRLGGRDFNVRVRVCAPDLIGESENCEKYEGENNFKPIGLLQEYGEDGSIHFGLLTGSYSKNKSGGMLRKNVGALTDEINDDGTFVRPSGEDLADYNGIIHTLDLLRIYGYRFDDGTYHRGSHGQDSQGSDGCLWSRSNFSDGHCTNWGNPQSEIYAESLRYLGGLSATGDYTGDDTNYIPNLNSASWSKPVTNNNYCAPLNVIQFNASTTSFDADMADGAASQLGLSGIDAATDAVGAADGLHNKEYFVGAIDGGTGDELNELCTPKSVSNLSDVRGTCPDAPRLKGSYKIAGLAYHARSEGVTINGVSAEHSLQKVTTYGVALAPAVPQISVPVPGTDAKRITLLPACRNTNSTLTSDANCAIVDFKVVEQNEETSAETGAITARTGKLYVNWEDSEQGGDFDQDMWGIITYTVTSDKVDVTTQVIAQSTGDPMGFGYVIGGTTADGFHVHSGVNNFRYTSAYPELFDGCGNTSGTRCTCRPNSGGTTGACDVADASAARTQSYDIGSSAALLENPLYYASKWGGYEEDDLSTEEIQDTDPEGESYFYANDPARLQEALRRAFDRVAADIGSASAVATNTTNLQEGSYVFQARFNSENWSGELLAYPVGAEGAIGSVEAYSTDDTLRTAEGTPARQIYTVGASGSIASFEWGSLSDTQKALLNAGDDRGEDRLRWLAGSRDHESASGGLRPREAASAEGADGWLLGDIVNSSPVYLGGQDLGYGVLTGDQGSSYVDYLEDTKRQQPQTIFVGANDGMLHAFDVEDDILSELFAYVPGGVYPKLANLTRPNYGSRYNPHEYTVDGPIAVGDAYIDGSWRSVLVGTLGAGGRGIYALDVTDRSNPSLLFELNGAEYEELGHVMGKPMIARMADGKWAAVFGNGYDSDEGTSQLFIVDFENPSTPTIIDTDQGSGLSGVALLGDAYGQVQYAYAGDLDGNLWKFDLSSSGSRNQWDVAYDNPMFQAEDDAGKSQPIFGAPTLGRNAQKNNAVMVYFGTGKYFEKNDNNVTASDPNAHSFYAIADKGSRYTGDRETSLHEKEITDSVSEEASTRTVDGGSPDWADKDGWFMDFDTRSGERVINKPLLIYDRLIFPTLIPSSIPCEFGGESWLMEVVAVGDRYVGEQLLAQDRSPGDLILGDPIYIIKDPETGKLLTSESDGDLASDDVDIPSGALGRQSWRQVR